MKHHPFFLALALAATVCQSSVAQEQIENAFQRMASDTKVKVDRSIQVDRKPDAATMAKTSVCEINSFTIEKAYKKNRYRYAEYGHVYVDNIAAAIQAEASNEQCYRIASYTAGPRNTPRQWNLLYGEDASQYVALGTEKNHSYIFACFADKDHPGYRWCYALEWWNVGYREYVVGRYIKLYAKIPEPTTSAPVVKYSGTLSSIPEIPIDTAVLKMFGKDIAAAFNGAQFNNARKQSQWTEEAFQSLNVLRSSWMAGDYETDTTLPVSIYSLVKKASTIDLFTDDERTFVLSQLESMIREAKQAGQTDNVRTAIAYLELARKLLRAPKE